MLASAVCTIPIANAQTAPSISDVPLFLNGSVAPLNMLVLGRDHKLYYEAYNDASDLNGDGVARHPATSRRSIDYYGYFDSYKCYTYDSRRALRSAAASTANKKCSGAAEWSGDFLNYLTMSRIDALRKVLYGGYALRQTPARPSSSAPHPAGRAQLGQGIHQRRRRWLQHPDYTPLRCRPPARGTCSPTRRR